MSWNGVGILSISRFRVDSWFKKILDLIKRKDKQERNSLNLGSYSSPLYSILFTHVLCRLQMKHNWHLCRLYTPALNCLSDSFGNHHPTHLSAIKQGTFYGLSEIAPKTCSPTTMELKSAYSCLNSHTGVKSQPWWRMGDAILFKNGDNDGHSIALGSDAIWPSNMQFRFSEYKSRSTFTRDWWEVGPWPINLLVHLWLHTQ